MAYETQNASSGRAFLKGDRVHVSGVFGEVTGEVIEAATPDEMPDLGPGAYSKEALDLMREMSVDLMLLIGHRHDRRQVCFWAVHNLSGWIDLHGQKLTIRKEARATGKRDLPEV